MKTFLLLSVLSTLLLSGDCNKKKSSAQKMKGRLEVAGICMNYTISVVEGNLGAGTVVDNWTDETTGKQYKNAFKLGNPCDFPATIKAGNEFHFIIDTTTGKQCAVCMAYYPTPPKALSIKVVE